MFFSYQKTKISNQLHEFFIYKCIVHSTIKQKLYTITVLILFFTILPSACKNSDEIASETNQNEITSAEMEKLRSIGYINKVPVSIKESEKRGVVHYDKDLTCTGLNLFNPRDLSTAQLMTLEEKILHLWSSNEKGQAYHLFKKLYPYAVPGWIGGWNHIALAPNGDLIAIGSHHMLLRLDWNSKVKWKLNIAAHHDVFITDSGEVVTIVDKLRTKKIEGKDIFFLDNLIVVLTEEGELIRTLSLFDALMSDDKMAVRLNLILKTIPQRLKLKQKQLEDELSQAAGTPDYKSYQEKYDLFTRALKREKGEDRNLDNIILHNTPADVFHSNSVQLTPNNVEGLWDRGDFLISILKLNSVAVISSNGKELLWIWGNRTLELQHHASQLEDNTILIFDNGKKRGYSRIIKVDPINEKIVWSYQADPPKNFFSASRGGVQQLPNGNILITETNKGHAFEITPEGKIVWDYYEKQIEKKDNEILRHSIYRMTRIDYSMVEDFLN